MPDKEEVIKGLEALQKSMSENQCYACSHEFIETVQEFGIDIITDALALLKGQEAVEPINSYGTFRCGNCKNIVGYNDGHWHGYQNNFCSKCGRPVKWDV